MGGGGGGGGGGDAGAPPGLTLACREGGGKSRMETEIWSES